MNLFRLLCFMLVTASNFHYAVPAATLPADSELENMIAEVYEIIDVPEECRDKTYCTIKPPSYPEERFDTMFEDKKVIPQPSINVNSMLSNRQGDPDERDDCQSDESFELLYMVRSKRDAPWLTVVQSEKHGYIQRVRLETCRNPGGSCFEPASTLGDIITFCKQKYIKFDFMVEKVQGSNKIEPHSVTLPVCCSCAYKSAPIESRFGYFRF